MAELQQQLATLMFTRVVSPSRVGHSTMPYCILMLSSNYRIVNQATNVLYKCCLPIYRWLRIAHIIITVRALPEDSLHLRHHCRYFRYSFVCSMRARLVSSQKPSQSNWRRATLSVLQR